MPLPRLIPILTIAALALVAPRTAGAAQQIVAAQSEVGFVSKQMGVPVQGRFERFDGQVDVDPANPETGKVSFTVDLGSASIGTAETLVELKKPDWFDVAKFPIATFRSTSIRSTGVGKIDVVGQLTIKGLTREVHVPMTLVRQGDLLKANGEFTVRRLDFRIGAGEWGDTGLVADDVLVRPKLTIQGRAQGGATP